MLSLVICFILKVYLVRWLSLERRDYMYFSNLLNSPYENARDSKKGSMSFKVGSFDNRVVGDAHVVVEDGNLTVRTGNEFADKDLFLHGFNVEDMSSKVMGVKSKSSLTYNDIRDTQDNPLIVVLARSIKFYAGVTTYIKYITMGSDVLAMLVFGACEFTFADGSSVPMQRCNTSNLEERRTFEYSGTDLLELSIIQDEESWYRMNDDMVNAVIVSYTSSKGTAFDCVRYKTFKHHTKVFNTVRLEAAREKVRIKKAKIEVEKARKQEEQRLAMLKAKKEKEEREREEQEEIDKQFTGVNAGALAFLNAIRQ